MAEMICLPPTQYLQAKNYYEDAVGDIAKAYHRVHSKISMGICVAGLVLNAAIIVVLAQASMRRSLINKLLIAVACWDMLLMAVDLLFKRVHGGCFAYSYTWTLYSLFYAGISPLAHTVSLWLTVLMAALRWFIIRSRRSGNSSFWLNSPTAAAVYIVVTFLFVATINVPNVLRNQVRSFGPVQMPADCGIVTDSESVGNRTTEKINSVIYFVSRPRWWTCDWERVNFIMAGVLFKIVPCILLTVFVAVLIRILIAAQRRRRALLFTRSINRGGMTLRRLTAERGSTAVASTRPIADRTTALLIFIVGIFLITELPQGVLVVVIAVRPTVLVLYQRYLGDFIDLLSLLNSCVNFVLYCTMSSQFRRQFLDVFGFKRLLAIGTAVSGRTPVPVHNFLSGIPDFVGNLRSRANSTWTTSLPSPMELRRRSQRASTSAELNGTLLQPACYNELTPVRPTAFAVRRTTVADPSAMGSVEQIASAQPQQLSDEPAKVMSAVINIEEPSQHEVRRPRLKADGSISEEEWLI